MKYTLYSERNLEINLELLAEYVIKSIQENFKSVYPEEFEEIVENYITDGKVDETLDWYDNYWEVRHTLVDDVVVWCIENKPEWCKLIEKYAEYLG